MPNTATAPNEADSLRRMAKAMNRVHVPATLLQFLLALLAFLTGNRSAAAQLEPVLAPAHGRTWRTPRRDWQFSPTGETIDDLAPVLSPRALRRLRQQRAFIGWILRCLPGLGMRRSGNRALNPRPTCTARAPPRPARVSFHLESAAKTPLPAAIAHAYRTGGSTTLWNRASPSRARRCASICVAVTHQRSTPPSMGSPRLARKVRQ